MSFKDFSRNIVGWPGELRDGPAQHRDALVTQCLFAVVREMQRIADRGLCAATYKFG